jgi:EpsD family peptidyl-prolyl cis-trans isomerase
MPSFKCRSRLFFSAGTLIVLLAGCGNHEEKRSATQVAARVGSEEISVHQINQILSRTNLAEATPQAVRAMSREVLEKLIDQQIAVDQALEKKLQRTPEVVSQIEAARREVLARAYLQNFVGATAKPTADQVKKYYQENPSLFSERRIFFLRELLIPADADTTSQLKNFLNAGKSVDEISVWLKGRQVKFADGRTQRSAEQIPLELLTKIHALKDGQSTLLETQQAVTLLQVISSQLSPLSEAVAMTRIEQFLINQSASEAVAANIKKIRGSTKIAYLGEFANAESPTNNSAPNATSVPAGEQSISDKSGKTSIEKGVAGLK